MKINSLCHLCDAHDASAVFILYIVTTKVFVYKIRALSPSTGC